MMAGTFEATPVIGIRQCPPAVLHQLREIDPKADLIYAAPGVWVLGVWNPNAEAVGRASRRLARLMQLPAEKRNGELAGRIAWYQVLARGFRTIAFYEIQDPDSSIVEDFRERDYNWRHRPDETFEKRLAEAEIDPDRGSRYVDSLHAQRVDVHRLLRGVHSFASRTARRVSSSARTLIRSIR